MAALFDACRVIPAHEVAQREGLRLQQRGSRQWACCPLHGEKTASLCFFPDGGWKCFGCNQGGDAVDFYAALHNLPALEAARCLAADFGLPTEECVKRSPSHGRQLRRALEAHRASRHTMLCRTLHRTRAVMEAIQTRAPSWGACWDNPLFIAALEAHSAAEIELEQLALSGSEELLQMAVNE